MYRGCSVAVVVPAYNEAGFVGDVVRSLPPYVDRAYVVDDASTDDTWREIREAARAVNRAESPDRDAGTSVGDAGASDDEDDGAEAVADGAGIEGDAIPDDARREPPGEGNEWAGETDEAAGEAHGSADEADESTTSATDPPAAGTGSADDGRRVVPVRHEENRGVGGAIKTGYRRACADDLDVVAVLAGDGQMDPELLDRLLDPVVDGRADYAKGNRLVRPAWRAEMPRFRLVGNAALALLTKVASGYWRVGDPQNGYTAVSSEALEDADYERMYEFYGYCNDLLVRLAVADARVADVPIPPTYGDEQSHIDLRTYVPRVSWMLLRTFAWRLAVEFREERNPAAVLYPAGALAGLVGVRDVARRARAAIGDDDGRAGDADGDERERGDAEPNRRGRPVAALLASALLVGLGAAVDWARKLPLAFRTDGDRE